MMFCSVGAAKLKNPPRWFASDPELISTYGEQPIPEK
jgi:hypothetical protein